MCSEEPQASSKHNTHLCCIQNIPPFQLSWMFRWVRTCLTIKVPANRTFEITETVKKFKRKLSRVYSMFIRWSKENCFVFFFWCFVRKSLSSQECWSLSILTSNGWTYWVLCYLGEQGSFPTNVCFETDKKNRGKIVFSCGIQKKVIKISHFQLIEIRLKNYKWFEISEAEKLR